MKYKRAIHLAQKKQTNEANANANAFAE